MSVDRRVFLGGGLLASGGLFHTAAAASPGRNAADFGVDPHSGKDQTDALQKAIDALGQGRGAALLLPAGSYLASRLTLPGHFSLIGTPGQTILRANEIAVQPRDETLTGGLVISGLVFLAAAQSVQIKAEGLAVRITDCSFAGGGRLALQLDGCSGTLEASQFQQYQMAAVSATGSNLKISGCAFTGCGTGVLLTKSSGAIVAQNQFEGCGAGIAADGVALLHANIVDKARQFGLKLGRDGGSGRVLAQANLLQDCEIGIGVSASGDTIFASLNLIHGSAKGAIRAFDGTKIVGPDLARESAEAYLNLTVAGNVVR